MSSSFAVFVLLSFALLGLSYIIGTILLILILSGFRMPDFIVDFIWDHLYLVFLSGFGPIFVSAVISFCFPGLQRKIGKMFSYLLNGLLN